MSSREVTYSILALLLLTSAFFFISFSDIDSMSRATTTKVSPSSHMQLPTHSVATHFVAQGSVKKLDELLRNLTNSHNSTHTPASRLVITIAVNYAYRNLALNFVCNLKRLRLHNYIVLAMDHTVFQFLAARGANVFFYTIHTHSRRRLLHVSKPMSAEDVFGSSAFLETARRKSLLVLKVLRLGYPVVFSDVDVVWINNPIPLLLQHQSDFVIQSDRSHTNQDTPLNYNLNSGFYYARSSPRTIIALQAIIKFSLAVRRSEQKAFNYVLCGAFKDHHMGPGSRIGANECTYRRGGATVIALPLDSFPNGSDGSLWSASNNFSSAHPEVVAVHANYVSGRAEKVSRIRRIGFWFHSEVAHRLDECVIPSPPKS